MEYSDSYKAYKIPRDMAWTVLFKYQIDTLPIDIRSLCNQIGIVLHSYASGKNLIAQYRLQPFTSLDGFSTMLKNNYVVFYNQDVRPVGRIRFTVCHEIYHIIIGDVRKNTVACRDFVTCWNHVERLPTNPVERAANIFASRLLAPACVLHALGLRKADEIANLCGLSHTAASIRAQRMETLYRREQQFLQQIGRSCFGQSPKERLVLQQFDAFIQKYKKQNPFEET